MTAHDQPHQVAEFSTFYAQLPKSHKIECLARLAFALTIACRGYYADELQLVNSGVGSPVGTLNELQHKISDYLSDLLAHGQSSYDASDFIAILADRARYGGCLMVLLEALEGLQQSYQWNMTALAA